MLTSPSKPDDALTCPACRGSGEGPEIQYQPVEGMAYLDAPTACPTCTPAPTWADYPDGPRPLGWVDEARFLEYCDEAGLCHGCAEAPPLSVGNLCEPCSDEEHADYLFHRDR